MIAKIFEVRDVGTFIPILAVKLEPSCRADLYLLERTGYGRSAPQQAEYIMVWRLAGGGESPATTDLYDHNSATMKHAHNYINTHFDKLPSGAVIDVEYILGRSEKPKLSESETDPA